MASTDTKAALDHIKSGNFIMGPDVERAHEICQAHEGEADYDWIHALVHRIEGDDGNAAYWYRRSGHERHPGTVEQEWQAIRDALKR